jgi:hypothetical protein
MEKFLDRVMTLGEKEKSDLRDSILKKRLEDILPHLMEEEDIDFWILIGREFNEGPVPVLGDLSLHNNTCHAMELNIRQKVEEWDNQIVYAYLEEDIVFDKDKVYFLNGRQEEFIMV